MEREDAAAEPAAIVQRTDSERAGIMIGILVSVLLALGVYFYWRGTGVQAMLERQPPASAHHAAPAR